MFPPREEGVAVHLCRLHELVHRDRDLESELVGLTVACERNVEVRLRREVRHALEIDLRKQTNR